MSAFSNTHFTTTVQFHQGELPLSYEELGIPIGSKFGIITQTVAETPMDQNETALIVTIDNSGSMESCEKILHVKHTVKNILRVIVEKAMPIRVQIGTFNDTYQEIVELTSVSSENIAVLNAKIGGIQADNGTNIEVAIDESQNILEQCHNIYNTYHFFLTDGNACIGECNSDTLIEKVSNKFPTAFIGYGEDHNANLLLGFSNKHTESSYQLVDNFEKIGNLCGELLFNVCYPAVRNVMIYTPSEDDLVYDPKKNTWSNAVSAGTFISGKTYRYPIYTTNEGGMIVNTIGQTIDNNDIETDVYIDDTTTDLTKELFRHATDRLLFLSITNAMENRSKVRELFKKVRAYARTHDLLSDTFYKLMFDDLYTCYTGEYMNIQARFMSNTRTQTFRSSSVNRQIRRNQRLPAGLHRSISATYNEMEDDEREIDEETFIDDEETVIDDENDIAYYQSENTQNDLNATQEMYGLMRAVST
jgi:uncharacterized protein YegL